MEDGHAKTSEEVLKFFGTNGELGLTSDQVKTLQAKYGPNGKFKNLLQLFLGTHHPKLVGSFIVATLYDLIARSDVCTCCLLTKARPKFIIARLQKKCKQENING
jgi:hypothetical protein